MFNAAHESFKKRRIENRLGEREFGSGLDFVCETFEVARVVRDRTGIGSDSDEKSRRLSDRLAADIDAFVESMNHIREPDGIDFGYGRGIDVIAELVGIARCKEKIAQTQSVGSNRL